MNLQTKQISPLVRWAAVVLAGAICFYLTPLALSVFSSGQWGKQSMLRSFVSTAYLLESNHWLMFSIPPEQSTLKLVTNASMPTNGYKVGSLSSNYAIEYRLLDRTGNLVGERSYNLRAEASTYKDPRTGALLPLNSYLSIPLVPLDSRLTMIPVRAGPGERQPSPPVRLDLKLASSDLAIKDVVVRVYYNEKPPPYKLRYLWQRMQREKKEHLSRGNIYTLDLLSAEEKQNLLENRWTALAPQGISQRDYTERQIYTVDSTEVNKVKDSVIPNGLFVSPDVLGVVPLPKAAGCVRLEFHRLEAPRPFSSQMVYLSWHGGPLEEARHWSLPLEGEVSSYSDDFDGGALEVYATEEIVVRASAPGLSETMEVTPESPSVPCYLVSRDSPVDFFISNYESSFTALRVDLRQAISKDLLSSSPSYPSVTLKYQLLDSSSRILETGVVELSRAVTLYDAFLGVWNQHRVTDPSRFYFWIPPGRTKLRLSAEEGEAFATGYTAVNGLPRRVRVPEDYLAYEKNQEEFGNWFLILPENYADCLRNNREAFVRVQDRPPMVSWQTFGGNYHSVVNRPVHHKGNYVMAYKILTPLEEWESIGPAFSPSYFSELRPGESVELLVGGGPGQVKVNPTLIALTAREIPSSISISIDQKPYLRETVGNPTNEAVLDDVSIGKHKVELRASEGLRVFINSLLAPVRAWHMERTVYRLDREGLTYFVRKETADRETLAMRLYFPADTAGRTKIRGLLRDVQRKESTPFTSWTFTNNIYDLGQPEGRSFPILDVERQSLAGGDLFFLSLGADLRPGSYEVSFFVEEGSPCFLYLSQIAPGRSELRRIFVEHDISGGELVDG